MDSLLKAVEVVVTSSLSSTHSKWATLPQTLSLGTRRIKVVAVVWLLPFKARADKCLNSPIIRPIKLHAALL